MSVDVSQDSLAKSNSQNAFVTAFVTNAAALAVQVGAFTYLKGKLHRVYSPRSFLPPPEKRAEKLPSGPWKWFIALVTSPTKDIIRKNGLDAYLFIRFLRVLIFIFGCFTIISWPILITVNTVGIPDNAGRDGISRLSWGNIPPNMQIRYVAHIIIAYILTFFVIWVIRRELATFIKLRHQFLISRSHSKLAQSKTVLITNLPDSVQTEQDLLKMLTFVPGGINKVWIYRQTGELPDLFDERNKVCKQLEKAECQLLRDALKAKREEEKARQDAERQTKKLAAKAAKERKGSEETTAAVELIQADVVRPTHRLGWVPLHGERVDTISWCKEEIVRLTEQIDKARKTLNKDQSHGAAFVQCNLQLGANILSQVMVSDEPLRMYDKWTDVAPDDIVWRNIDDSGYETRARYVISWLAMLGLIVAWTFPVAFVGLLSNVSSLCVKVHWLAWICRLSDIPQGIIQGILPPVFLAILFLILPWILRGLAWYENIPRWSLISLSVYKRYYVFLVVHGFLVVTLSSGLTSSIPKILSSPGSVIEDLSTRLPDASTFFLTYTVTAGLAGAASALLQIAGLVLYFVHRWLFGDTPRQAYQKTYVMPTADFGVILPRISLIATIALAYSVIAPVINGLALLASFLLWVAWKYLFTWVFDQPDAGETGGLYYPLALGNLFVGLYIEQICLAGLFFLATDAQGKRSSIPQGVLMVVLLAITLASHVLFVHSYGPLTKNLPTVLSTKKIQDRWERKQRGDHQILPDLFSRERVSNLVRRKLKIESKPVDAAAVIAEEKRKEAEKMEEKEQKAKENTHDLEMLKAIVNSSFVNGTADTPPAEKTLDQAVSSSIDPNIGASGSVTATQPVPSNPPASSSQQPTGSTPGETGTKEHSYPPNPGAPLSRQSTGGSNASRGSKGKSPAIADATPAMTLRPGIDSQTKDNSDDDDEDDIEDNAFNHPSTYKPTPIIWIPKDDLGLSVLLVEELTLAGVSASDVGAFINENGDVDVSRNPPDEEWTGGHDR
ncbi:hypothetical protein M407DRAFT_15343 [Tulasnella calospora MUT 4182]|uniref:DUF221-domain-containing protein n=1 Tax=Tulasnella calospora MUT 4182 TaxID=1051891 RepID=A0A0C3Q6D3_9AGAM|nr:hypothetical protein M407DRAFT_15343 [Tulasnella calospora MUT 4182]